MKTGKLIQGSILDCNPKYLERALRDYDKQLYLKWNPLKTAHPDGSIEKMPPPGPHWRGYGVGVWEVRRQPNTKTMVPWSEVKGECVFFELKYKESDVLNHVMDVPVLNYSILDRIKEMDCWNTKNYVDDLEYREDQAKDKEYTKNRAELRYQIKHHRSAFKDFQEQIRSGRNPLDFLAGNW